MLIQHDAWQPPLHPKGAEIVNDRHRFLLVTGAKLSTKTISICHKLTKHLYEQRGAHIGIIVKRQEVGRLGVWPDITEFVIPKIWQADAGVVPWIIRPKVLSDTKRRIFSVMNHCADIGRCSLISAYRSSEIEQLLKNTRFSMIYVNEADQFPASIFNACADQLRMEHMGVPYEAHQLILDCNPPNEGEKHWLHKIFFDPAEKDQVWYRDYKVITATIEDNPWLNQKDLESLIQRYRNHPRQYARYILSQWVPSSEGSIFENVFEETTHVVGEINPGQPRHLWSVLMPPMGTNEIIRGWDLGDVNHSCVFITKRLYENAYCYDVIDDLTLIDRPTSIREFTRQVMDKSDFWQDVLTKRGADGVRWVDWADPTAFIFRSSGQGSTHSAEVYAASRKQIRLRPVKKGPGSVAARVSLMMRLLLDGRLSLSVLSRACINAMIGLKPSSSGGVKRSPEIHAFDAMSYGIGGEIGGDLRDEANQPDEITTTVENSSVVSVRL